MTRTFDRIVESVYATMHEIAARQLVRPPKNGSVSPTDIVHECYLKLTQAGQVPELEKTHFLALSARVMRQVLVDHARQAQTEKHGDNWRRVTLHAQLLSVEEDVDLLVLHEALERLERLYERQARIVELRYFSGLSIEETADALGISPRTVDGDWQMARAWLRRELTR